MDTKIKTAWNMDDAIQLLQDLGIKFLYLLPVCAKHIADLQKTEDMFNTKMRVPCWAITTVDNKKKYLRMDNAEFLPENVVNRVNIILPEQGVLNEIKNGLSFRILKEESTGKYYWDDVPFTDIGGRFWESIVLPRVQVG